MKKNIVLLSGRDTYGIVEERKKWIQAFKERHSEMNIEHVNLSDIKNSWKTIEQNILSSGLFAEKRLFIISGGNEKRDKNTDFIEFFTRVFEVLPDDHFLLFSDLSERGLDLIPLITRTWEVKKFDTLYNSTTWGKRFPDLDSKIISRVIDELREQESLLEEWEINGQQSHLIASILEVLSIESLTTPITDASIDRAIGDLSGGKIFSLVDAIANGDIKKSLTLFSKISSGKSMYEFLPSFIGAIRNTIYVKYMYQYHITSPWIKINPFVVKKVQSAKVSYPKIRDFYHRLIEINIAYKSGKGMKDTELWRILEIELAIIWLKK